MQGDDQWLLSLHALFKLEEDSPDLRIEVRQISCHDLPHDRWVHVAIPMGKQVPHVHDLTPRNLMVLLPEVGRQGVGGLTDRLDPMDHRGEQDFFVDEFPLGIWPMTIDRLDQLDDVEEEIPIRIHRPIASL